MLVKSRTPFYITFRIKFIRKKLMETSSVKEMVYIFGSGFHLNPFGMRPMGPVEAKPAAGAWPAGGRLAGGRRAAREQRARQLQV